MGDRPRAIPADDVTLHQNELANAGVSYVKIRGDRKLFVTGGWDHKVRVWKNNKSMTPLAVLDYHRDVIQSCAFDDEGGGHRGGKLLACSSKDNKISVYDVFGHT